VADPPLDPVSSWAAYTLGTLKRLDTIHSSSRGLRPYAEIHSRQYRTFLPPSEDPQADARDPRWTTQRAVGSPAFMAPYVPRRRGRPRIGARPSQNQQVRP
jgi:hypothetical protein